MKTLFKKSSILSCIQRSFHYSLRLLASHQYNYKGNLFSINFSQQSYNDQQIQKALQSNIFQEWLSNMYKIKEMQLEGITIQSIDMFGEKVGFLKFVAHVAEQQGKRSFVVFMRGGSVAVLPILQCEGEEYVVLVTQTSIPTAQPWFPSIPAGMLDQSGDFVGVAAKELAEETGIIITKEKLIDMTKLAYQERYRGVFVSVGGTDEYVKLYLFRDTVEKQKLQELQGKLTGVKEENENIRVEIVNYKDLWKHTSDVKALCAVLLYENLKKEGKLEDVRLTNRGNQTFGSFC